MVNPSISIVTPFFDQGVVFWDTFRSVLTQSFSAWEWVIVDDGSQKPSSLDLLRQLKEYKDPRIVVLTLENNKGLPAARNAGVVAASAELIFFLDSDDLIEPDYLEKAWITLLLNPSFSFVNSWSTGFGARTYNWRAGLDKGRLFLRQNWVAFAGLFRRSVLLRIPFNETRRKGLEDWEFWLASAAQGYWGYTLPERLFHYRIHENNHKKWENWDNGKRQKKIAREFRKKFAPPRGQDWPAPRKTRYPSAPPQLLPPAPDRPRQTPDAEKTRVMVVLPWLHMGGVEWFTRNWMQAMKDRMQYLLITTNASHDNDSDAFDTAADEIFHLSHLGDITAYPAMIEYLVSSRQPQLIVLSHAEPFYHLLPFIRQRFPRIPILDINHIEDPKWHNGGYPAISSDFTAFISSHIVISDWLKRFMTQRGVREDKLETVYIGADTAAIRPLPPEEKAARAKEYFAKPADTPVILFAARLTHQKNVLLLPAIAKALTAAAGNIYFVVCGDGPDYEALQELLHQQNLTDSFLLTGAVDHEKLIAYMQAATLLVLPSKWEGIATVLYEAMAAGLPVIATDVGGQRELVTHDTGILVPAADDAQLVAYMVSAVQNLLKDSRLHYDLQQNARKRIAGSFDASTAFSKLESLFNRFAKQTQTSEAPAGDQMPEQEKELIFNDYLKFASQWNILHQKNDRQIRSNGRLRSAVKRIYKVAMGKRPLTHLWKRT